MNEMRFSRSFIIVLVCFMIGLIMPYLFMEFSAKLVLFVVALAGFVFMLLMKRGRITVYDWLILFFIGIPFHDFRITLGTFFLRTTEVFFIPFFVWAVVQLISNNEDRRNIASVHVEYIVLLFFCAFSFLSIAGSIQPFISIYRTVVLVYLIGMSIIIAKILKGQDTIYLIIKSMIAVAALASFYAILQSFIPALHPFYPIPLASVGSLKIYRSGVGWQNANYFALYVSMILPVTYVCKISKGFKERKFLNVCFFLQLLGLFSSYSRLGFISIFITFLFLLVVRGKKNQALILLVTVIALIVTAFFSMEYIYKHNPYLAITIFRVPNLRVILEDPLLVAGWRRDAWIANINMFLDNPFLGIGPFMSTAMYSQYKPYDQVYPLKEDLAVHNEYLSLLSERGIFGAVLFLIFLFFLTTRAIVYYKNNKFSVQGKLMLGLWASIINFIFFSFGGATIYSVQFWINVGIIFALYNSTKTKRIDNDLRNEALND